MGLPTLAFEIKEERTPGHSFRPRWCWNATKIPPWKRGTNAVQ